MPNQEEQTAAARRDPPGRRAAPPKLILILAGEVSGDMHAARLVAAIRRRLPDAAFIGIGGEEMRAAGVETQYDVAEMAVMGFTEVVRRFGFFHRVFREMFALARARRPDAVLLVDYPGFNLRFAARAHAAGLKTIYYICPQVWAWNRRRIPRMARVVDRLIAIFPFEREVFAGTGLRVDFAGHPLVDEARQAWSEPPAELPWRGEPRVALLPGSREHEIKRILPAMWTAAAQVQARHPSASFLIAAPSKPAELIVRATLAARGGGPKQWDVATGRTRQVLRQATAAWVASGTATIEAALMLCPLVVVYRVAALTYLLGKLLVRVPHIGMVNIVAGRRLCPELVQNAATPAALAAAIEPLLSATPERAGLVAGLQAVAAALGPGGSVERAADIVAAELNPSSRPLRSPDRET